MGTEQSEPNDTQDSRIHAAEWRACGIRRFLLAGERGTGTKQNATVQRVLQGQGGAEWKVITFFIVDLVMCARSSGRKYPRQCRYDSSFKLCRKALNGTNSTAQDYRSIELHTLTAHPNLRVFNCTSVMPDVRFVITKRPLLRFLSASLRMSRSHAQQQNSSVTVKQTSPASYQTQRSCICSSADRSKSWTCIQLISLVVDSG